MSRFQLVAENSTTYPVKRLSELVEIECSSYYAWQAGTPDSVRAGYVKKRRHRTPVPEPVGPGRP